MSAFNSLRHRKEQPLMAPDRLELLSLYGNMLTADPNKRFDYADFHRKPAEPAGPAYLKPGQIVPVILPTHVTPGARLDLHDRIPDAPADAFSPPEDFLINNNGSGNIAEESAEPNLTPAETAEEITAESRLTLRGLAKAIPIARQKIQSAWEARHKITAIFEKDEPEPEETEPKPSFIARTHQRSKELLANSDAKKNFKKAAIGVGILATGLAVATVSYKLGVNLTGSSKAVETTNDLAPKNAHQQLPDALSILSSGFKAQAQEHLQRVYRVHQHLKSVNLKPGSGYTQVLQDYFQGKSPAQYLQAYKDGIKTLGPDFIKGVHHYKMADGSYGLKDGHMVHLTQKGLAFFSDYFKKS